MISFFAEHCWQSRRALSPDLTASKARILANVGAEIMMNAGGGSEVIHNIGETKEHVIPACLATGTVVAAPRLEGEWGARCCTTCIYLTHLYAAGLYTMNVAYNLQYNIQY